MKQILVLFTVGLFSTFGVAQEQKAKIEQCVVLLECHITTPSETMFKSYELKADDFNWNTQQDIFNSISAVVPGIRISTTYLNEKPTIRTRACDDTIIIVDGVRYDASILNTINPSDIETIEVANNPAALTYYLGNRRN